MAHHNCLYETILIVRSNHDYFGNVLGYNYLGFWTNVIEYEYDYEYGL